MRFRGSGSDARHPQAVKLASLTCAISVLLWMAANSVLPSAISSPRSSDRRVALGLKDGYVRRWTDRNTNLELIVAAPIAAERESRYFGVLHGSERASKRRLFDVLRGQGLQANQDVTFQTDDEVRALTEFVTPAAEHALDWFHTTMRVTLLTQVIGGVAHQDAPKSAPRLKSWQRIRWPLGRANLRALAASRIAP
jgi:hypothetical protein